MPATEDPAYAAYMRALGFDEDLARKDAERRKAQAAANAQLAKPELMAQGGEQREHISDSFEDRGMFMGTERLRDLASQRRGETYSLALIDKGLADTTAGVEMDLAREIAGIGRQRLDAQAQHDAWAQAQAQSSAGGVLDPVARAMQLVGTGRSIQQRKIGDKVGGM